MPLFFRRCGEADISPFCISEGAGATEFEKASEGAEWEGDEAEEAAGIEANGEVNGLLG